MARERILQTLTVATALPVLPALRSVSSFGVGLDAFDLPAAAARLGRFGRGTARRTQGFDMAVRYRKQRPVDDVNHVFEAALTDMGAPMLGKLESFHATGGVVASAFGDAAPPQHVNPHPRPAMPDTTPYASYPNRFKQDLLAGKRLIGCWCSLANPITTEVLGVAGFDWLLLDGEHSPNDVISFIPQLMALKDSVSAPVVRPSWNNAIEMKRLLDAGFYNFLVPFIESPEEAARAVAATRYPPQGIRGVSVSQRSNRYGTVPGYFQGINDHICVMLQIESRAGVAAVTDIAAVDGVDGIFVGPSDLAAGMGHLGNANHPDVQQAITAIFDAARAAGKPAGILAPVEADARRYLDAGATFVAVGSDLGVFRSATQALRDRYMVA